MTTESASLTAINSQPGPVTPTRHRRWWRLSLRSLMLLVLVAGGWVGWQARRASIQRRAVAAIKAIDGSVSYAHQFPDARWNVPSRDQSPPGPAWLRRQIGDEYFQEVAVLRLPTGHDATASDLAKAAEFPGLRRLEIGPVRQVGDGFRHLAGLRHLQELEINGGGVTDAMLADIGQLTALKQLGFQGKITNDGLRALRALNYLEILRIGRAYPVTGESLVGLIEANPRLRFITLNETGADDATMAAIGHLTHLELLELPHTKISDKGLAHLSRRAPLTNLNLNGTDVGDAGLAHLGSLPQLEWLSLEGLQVTHEGLAHLAHLPLRTLVLDQATVDDAGLEALRPLAPTLTGLGLNETQVTDKGIAHLTGFGRLHGLHLVGTPTTAKGQDALDLALPNLYIYGRKLADKPKPALPGL